jgi:hypothetical protein
MKLAFSKHVSEKYSVVMKIRPAGAELFHADKRTDMTQFCERAKKKAGNFVD